jgi:hypothetical protein
MGPLSVEYVVWNQDTSFKYWFIGLKPYYCPERQFYDLSKLSVRDIAVNPSKLIHFPPLDAYPQLSHLSKIRFYDIEQTRKIVNPKSYPRVSVMISGLNHGGIKHLMPESLDSLCSKSDIRLKEDVRFMQLISRG